MSHALTKVIAEMRQRETFGLAKYSASIDRSDFSAADWLQHAKEEAMDLVLYLQRLQDTLP